MLKHHMRNLGLNKDKIGRKLCYAWITPEEVAKFSNYANFPVFFFLKRDKSFAFYIDIGEATMIRPRLKENISARKLASARD